jgi:hypothetical protein
MAFRRSGQIRLNLFIEVVDENCQDHGRESPEYGGHERRALIARRNWLGYEMALRPGACEHSFSVIECFTRNVNSWVMGSAVMRPIVEDRRREKELIAGPRSSAFLVQPDENPEPKLDRG